MSTTNLGPGQLPNLYEQYQYIATWQKPGRLGSRVDPHGYIRAAEVGERPRTMRTRDAIDTVRLRH